MVRTPRPCGAAEHSALVLQREHDRARVRIVVVLDAGRRSERRGDGPLRVADVARAEQRGDVLVNQRPHLLAVQRRIEVTEPIVDNALRHTPAGGVVTLGVRLDPSAPTHVMVDISNSGSPSVTLGHSAEVERVGP